MPKNIHLLHLFHKIAKNCTFLFVSVQKKHYLCIIILQVYLDKLTEPILNNQNGKDTKF